METVGRSFTHNWHVSTTVTAITRACRGSRWANSTLNRRRHSGTAQRGSLAHDAVGVIVSLELGMHTGAIGAPRARICDVHQLVDTLFSKRHGVSASFRLLHTLRMAQESYPIQKATHVLQQPYEIPRDMPLRRRPVHAYLCKQEHIQWSARTSKNQKVANCMPGYSADDAVGSSTISFCQHNGVEDGGDGVGQDHENIRDGRGPRLGEALVGPRWI